MPDYRIYVVDEHGHIAGPAHVITCATDEEAIEKAKPMIDRHDIELWDGARKIAKISASG